jgi:hypothetical protein
MYTTAMTKITTITTVAICFTGGGSGSIVSTHHTRARMMHRINKYTKRLITL